MVIVERACGLHRRRLDGGRDRQAAERIPDRLCSRATTPARSAARSGRTSWTASIGRRPATGPTGSLRPNHAAATWLNPAAFTTAPADTFGNAPRTITDVRTPPQQNVDLSFSKNIRLGGTQSAQIRVEVVNLLNRVHDGRHRDNRRQQHVRADLGQSGFMRLTQFSFRYSF